jgi:geranylgeranyl pyrophosphate synthase
LIYLREAEPQSREMIQTVLSEGTYSTVRQKDLLEAITRTGSLDRARARANEYAEDARSALDQLPDSDYTDSLRSLPTYILDRDR